MAPFKNNPKYSFLHSVPSTFKYLFLKAFKKNDKINEDIQLDHWRQQVARNKCVMEQTNLQEFGITPVYLCSDSPETTFFSISNDPSLYTSIDEILAKKGLSLIITIDRRCYIEPYV